MPEHRTCWWNPTTQQLDYLPTKTQMTVLRDLCARTEVNVLDVYPTSRRDAAERIAGLIKLRKAQQRRAKRARKRAERLRRGRAVR